MAKQNRKNKIDWYITTQVRKLRLQAGLSQEDLAVHLDLSTGFIGHIESPNFPAKFNTGHLNELAKLFNCSPREFLPEKPLS